jgi:hypothetical protein
MKMAAFWVVVPCSLIFTDVSEVLTAMMIVAVSMSETSVNFYQDTWGNNPHNTTIVKRRSF